jgi:hypothetical protein
VARAELVGARYRITGGHMPKVERTGIYRNAAGHGFFLRKDGVISEEVAASYEYQDGAKLSPARARVVAAENGAGVVVASDAVAGPVAPGSIESAPSSNDPVESRELTTESYPASVDGPTEAASVSFAPGGRRKRKRKVETPEDDAAPIETPEDGAAVETPEDDDEDAE